MQRLFIAKVKVTDAKLRSIRASKIRCQLAKIIDAKPIKLIDLDIDDRFKQLSVIPYIKGIRKKIESDQLLLFI